MKQIVDANNTKAVKRLLEKFVAQDFQEKFNYPQCALYMWTWLGKHENEICEQYEKASREHGGNGVHEYEGMTRFINSLCNYLDEEYGLHDDKKYDEWKFLEEYIKH